MKRGWFAAALLFAALCVAPASAQTLPGVECFSPGLVRVSEALDAGAAVSVEAEFIAENAFFARDLSVLSAMLSGTTFVYDGSGDGDKTFDALRISREGETLFDAALTRDESGTWLSLGGETYTVAQELLPRESDLAAQAGALPVKKMLAFPLFERVPLASIAAWLESLKVGDALPGGLSVTRAFTVERTMSDDGERLTRIDISGALALPGQEPYEVTGYLRQPGGRSPKDTFEITATQDKDNHFTLSYSSTRSSEITRKDRAGKNTVQTTLRSEGELAGYRITSRLTVRLTNDWTADDERLSEKISVSATLGHTDRTPGRQMIRLNDMSAELHATLSLRTGEEDGQTLTFTDSATLAVKLDGSDFLGGGVKANVTVGGEGRDAGHDGEATPGEAMRALETSEDVQNLTQNVVRELAAAFYARLSENARAKVESGLNLE